VKVHEPEGILKFSNLDKTYTIRDLFSFIEKLDGLCINQCADEIINCKYLYLTKKFKGKIFTAIIFIKPVKIDKLHQLNTKVKITTFLINLV